MVVIRKAQKADIQQILTFYNKLMDQHKNYSILYRTHARAHRIYRTFLKKAIISPHAIVLVAEENKKIVGFVTCLIEKRLPRFIVRKAAYLYDIYIDKKYRQQRIGKKFINLLKRWACSKKVSYIKLEVSPKNKKAYLFWKNRGFYIFQHKMAYRI